MAILPKKPAVVMYNYSISFYIAHPMLSRLYLIITLAVLSIVGHADSILANNVTCPQNYLDQTPPEITNKTYADDTIPLCFDGFAVMYSGVSKTALWSAENLTRERIEQASKLERTNSFHPEARLPNSIKAQLADYSHTPFDRGHLAPNGDMATNEQQYDSFSLANIVPQNAQHNRYLWKDLESHARYLSIKYGQVYVVTGVAFLGNNVKQLNQRILIPTHLYKAIYVPKLGQAGVYFSPNDDSQRVEVISLDELNHRIGVSVFPQLAATIKSTALPLPTSLQNTPTTRPDSTKVDNSLDQMIVVLAKVLWAILQWLTDVLKH